MALAASRRVRSWGRTGFGVGACLLLLVCCAAVAFGAGAGAGGGTGPAALTAAKKPACRGAKATIVGNSRNNRLKGTRRRDVIVAGKGSDVISGGGGRDAICAGAGNDRVSAGSGNDLVLGDSGKDRIAGGAGKDRVSGERGNDDLRGDAGNDVLNGGPGTDRCLGGAGVDTLSGCETGDRPPTPTPPNRAPTANDGSATTVEDQPVPVTLSGSDPDGDPLSFAVTAAPSRGTLSGTPPNLTYRPSQDVTGADSLRFTVSDGKATSAQATFRIAVSQASARPVVDTTDTTLAYTENLAAVEVDPGVLVSDSDDAQLEGASARISSGFQVGDDLLFTDQAGITGTYNSGTGVLTLTGTASTAAYQTALRSVRYRHTEDAPSASKTAAFAVSDGDGDSAPATRAISVTSFNDAPILDTTDAPLAYVEGDGERPVDPGLAVDDPDSAQLSGATVSITGNFVAAQDDLAFVNQNGITGSYSDVTGQLTLSGNASVADYRTAMRSVAYVNSSNNPSTSTRSVMFQVTDSGSAASNMASRDVTVAGVNDAPVVSTSAGSTAYTEGGAATPVDGALTVSDEDDVNLNGATVRVSTNFQPGDELSFVNQNGITHSYDSATGVLTLTGTVSKANYQTALRSIAYRHVGVAPAASKTVEFKANDGEVDSAPASKTIAITTVNTAPVLATSGGSTPYTENEGPKAIDPALTLSDPDSQISGATVSVTSSFSSAQDDLGFVNQNGITGSYNDTTGVLTLSGTASVAAYQTALRMVTYTNVSDSPSPSTRTISFQATDADGAPSNAATKQISITATNDAPTAVNDSHTTDEDTALAVAAPGVLGNDTDPDPGDTKTVNKLNGSATLTGTSVDGAAVTINSNGSFTYNPGSIYQGLATGQQDTDSFTYTMRDGALAESTATVNITITGVSDAPVANDDASNTNGNTALYYGTTRPAGQAGRQVSGSILTNDTDPDTPAASLTAAPAVDQGTILGGKVTIETDGNFTYTPPAGSEGVTDSFSYTVSDGVASDSGAVSIPLAQRAWYVKNDAPANGLGRSTDPFDTIAEAEAASNADDTVYVFRGNGTTTGLDTGYAMLNSGERLLGEAVNLTMDPDGAGALGSETYFTGAGANRPTVTATNEDVVVLASGGTVSGLTLDPAGTGGGIFGGGGVNGSTIADMRIVDLGTAGIQPGLELDGTTGTHNVSDLVVNNSAASSPPNTATGVRLNNAGTAVFNPATQISITTAGAAGLSATGTAMGTSTFDDIAVTGSSNGGVNLDGTTGTTTLGDGTGTDLALTTTSGSQPGFRLNNAGSVAVGGAGSDNVSATGGPAVDSVATSGTTLDFDDIDSTNSASDGINLDGLGAGTFTAATGDIGGAAGIAFDLNGGSGAITYPGTLNNGSGSTAEITGRSGGTVSLTGSINDTNDAGGGINMTGNTGGSTTFSNGTKTLNTGAGDAVVFNNSDGHTLTLPGGALDIDTSSGKGLEATNSGTINVPGSANTIDTSSGRALNLTNTDIGGSGVLFQRIASSGAPNGILLNNTGAGAFSVTGTGAANSGGTIQNSTGSGVSLTSVPGGVSLTRSTISGSADDGIGGSTVNALSLDNVAVTSNGNANGDHGLDFTQLTGTVPLSSSNVSNNFDSNVVVSNASGTLNLNVNGGTYSGATGGSGDGIFVEGTGTGSQNLNVQGPITFSNNVGSHVQHGENPTSTADSDVTINNATMSSPAGGGSVLGGGITVNEGGTTSSGSNTDVTITNNNIQNSVIGAIAVGTTGSVVDQQIARVDATITGNTIGTTGVAGSGSVQGNGIFVDSNGNSVVRALITNNTVRQWTNRNGIALDVIDGDAEMSATIRGNVFTEPNSAFAGTTTRGMTIQLGAAQAGDLVDACLDIGDAANNALKNQVFGTGEGSNPDIRWLHEGPAGSAVQLVGLAGAGDQANITSALQTRNNIGGTPTVSGAFSPNPNVTSAASCPLPAP